MRRVLKSRTAADAVLHHAGFDICRRGDDKSHMTNSIVQIRGRIGSAFIFQAGRTGRQAGLNHQATSAWGRGKAAHPRAGLLSSGCRGTMGPDADPRVTPTP